VGFLFWQFVNCPSVIPRKLFRDLATKTIEALFFAPVSTCASTCASSHLYPKLTRQFSSVPPRYEQKKKRPNHNKSHNLWNSFALHHHSMSSPSTPPPGLTSNQKRLIKRKQPYIILKSFLEVSETYQAKREVLYSKVNDVYQHRVRNDGELTFAMQQYLLYGNRGVELDRKKIWQRAKEYKKKIVNLYLPCIPKEKPSGTQTDDQLLEIGHMEIWLRDERQKALKKKTTPSASRDECPTMFEPLAWWAFLQLHAHPKLQKPESTSAAAAAGNEDPEKNP
jgi:hypothetical protein